IHALSLHDALPISRQPLFQAVGNALIVTSLKVQAGHVFQRAPPAPVKRVVVAHADRRRDHLAITLGGEHHQGFRQLPGEEPEELRREIGMTAAQVVGAGVATVQRRQRLVIEIVSRERAEADAGVLDPPPLAADSLAPLVVERGQETVEIAEAAIPPDEAYVHARQEAVRPPQLVLGFVREEYMPRDRKSAV